MKKLQGSCHTGKRNHSITHNVSSFHRLRLNPHWIGLPFFWKDVINCTFYHNFYVQDNLRWTFKEKYIHEKLGSYRLKRETKDSLRKYLAVYFLNTNSWAYLLFKDLKENWFLPWLCKQFVMVKTFQYQKTVQWWIQLRFKPLKEYLIEFLQSVLYQQILPLLLTKMLLTKMF